MAKRTVPLKTGSSSGKAASRPFQIANLGSQGYLFASEFWFQAIIIVNLAVFLNYNSWTNHYALDDDIVMRQNAYVQKGFAGIGEILSNDAYKSFYESMGVKQQLSGGRYRPLSIVTFAIEQSLFADCYGERFEQVRDSVFAMQQQGISDIGSQSRLIGEKNILELQIKEANAQLAPYRHIFQIFWFALSMIVLLRFLRRHIFRANTDIAFLATVLFVLHPIHTEVIANVKSRDEIFSLMFVILTLDFFFRYDLKRKMSDVFWACVCFFLAFLSKEYAIVIVVLVPLGLMILHKRSFSNIRYTLVPLLGVVAIYGLLRLGVADPDDRTPEQKAADKAMAKKTEDPLNSPYMFAKGPEEILSKVNRLDDYVWLLFVPYPLAADYSYQHFPYSGLDDPFVYLSLLVIGSMLYLTWWLWQRKHVLAFAMLFFFGFYMLINNLVFDIGATMGERLIYHSSLGFCMCIAWGIVWLAERAQEAQRKLIVTGIVLALAVPSTYITWERNLEWDTDESLFIADVQKHPNSTLCNGNAGARFMDRGLKYLSDSTMQDSVRYYADTAIFYLDRAVKLHKRYANGWLNLGLCYYNKKDYENASLAWAQVYDIFPSNPILQSYAQMLIGMAEVKASKKDYAGAAQFYHYALRAYPADGKIWLNCAGSNFMAKNFVEAQKDFISAIENTKDEAMHENFRGGYRSAHYIDSIQTQWLKDSMNPELNMKLVLGIYGTPDWYPQTLRCLDRVIAADPSDARANKIRDSIAQLQEKLMPQPLKAIDSTKISSTPTVNQTPQQPTPVAVDDALNEQLKAEAEAANRTKVIFVTIFLYLFLAAAVYGVHWRDKALV